MNETPVLYHHACTSLRKHDGVLDKVSNWLRPSEHKDEPLNIFTIASGHMYERLQKIMILSVIKNTKYARA